MGARARGFAPTRALLTTAAAILVASKGRCEQSQKRVASAATYGVDISIPVHRATVSTNYDYLPHNVAASSDNGDGNGSSIPIPEAYAGMPIQPLGNRQEYYDRFVKHWKENEEKEEEGGAKTVDEVEEDRLRKNLLQPSISVNFTATGYKKVRAPSRMMELLTNFLKKNYHHKSEEDMQGLINQYDKATYMVDVWNEELDGGGDELGQEVWDTVREISSKWVGQELVGSSLYGIRIYQEGAILLPHVDRMPLVVSAIINVDQDIDEPWPLEVYGRDGMAVNVTMEPGDIVLYESHSLIHGRPFELKGRRFANVFVHFQPKNDALNPDGIPSYIRPDVDPNLLEEYYTYWVARNEQNQQGEDIEGIDDDDEDAEEMEYEDEDDEEEEDEEDDEDEDEEWEQEEGEEGHYAEEEDYAEEEEEEEEKEINLYGSEL
ncbi:hypothetical protein ACHAWF_016170 [Thalassiosira exigua]